METISNLLNKITWAQYIMGLGVVATVYYLVVAAVYFREDIMKRFHGADDQSPFVDELEDDNPAGELMHDLEHTIKDIEHSILVPGKQATKEELLSQLKISVANFGGLGRPGYRYALNNYIIEKAQEHCGTDFSEEELDEAWDSLSR